jgi:adenylate kinase family enzyme
VSRDIFCVSGEIASGKTTFANQLTQDIPGARLCSYGDVVRSEARIRGLEPKRPILHALAIILIAEGWPRFTERLITHLPADYDALVVDGVRHLQAVDELRAQIMGSSITSVFIDTPDSVIAERLQARGEALTVRDHKVEAQLSQVRQAADLTVDGCGDLQQNTATAIHYAQLMRSSEQ